MAEPYLAEIRIFSFSFAPKGWAMCNGQFVAINQNQAVFALIGTFYGGNGQTNFQLPNLQGRISLGQGNNFVIGEQAGEASHTLTVAEMPTHTHQAVGTNADGTQNSPQGKVWAKEATAPGGLTIYGSAPDTSLSPAAIQNTGGSQPHSNMMPYLVLNFCIALQGIFPSQN
jgi:microcystin-dependent protein